MCGMSVHRQCSNIHVRCVDPGDFVSTIIDSSGGFSHYEFNGGNPDGREVLFFFFFFKKSFFLILGWFE